MQDRHKRARTVLNAVACSLAALGCSPMPPRSAGGAEGSVAVVRAFWAAHADRDAMRKPFAVAFTYEVESLRDGDRARFAKVAFRHDDYQRIWVARNEASDLEEVPLGRDLEWEGSPGIGCALATIRYLFSVPLGTARGRWEIRRLMTPSDVLHEEALEASPLEPGAAVGTCRLELEEGTSLLESLVYAPRHQFARGSARRVRFGRWEVVDGVRVALEREGDLFREALSAVRFLSREEADQLLPLEQK